MLAELLETAATLLVAAALGTAALVLTTTRSIRTTVPVLLDLLAAAGVIRLASANTWSAIGSAALVVVIRKITVAGLSHPESTVSDRDGHGHPPAPPWLSTRLKGPTTRSPDARG